MEKAERPLSNREELQRRTRELVADSKANGHMENYDHWTEVAKMMDTIDEAMFVSTAMKEEEYPEAVRKFFIQNATRFVIHTKGRANRRDVRATAAEVQRKIRKRPVPKSLGVVERKVVEMEQEPSLPTAATVVHCACCDQDVDSSNWDGLYSCCNACAVEASLENFPCNHGRKAS